MKKSAIFFLTLFLGLSIVLASCSGSNFTSSNDNGNKKDGKTDINFWYSLEGDNGDTLKEIVDDFNKQSDSVHVNPVFQGDYEAMRKKIRTMGATDKAPAVFQGSDDKYLSTSGFITPMQNMIDKDDDFDSSNMDKSIIDNFSLNDKLYSMPFNVSTQILFYNKDMFKKAGLDPDKPPKTYGQVEEYAKKLTDKDKGVYGFSIPTAADLIPHFFATQGQLYFNKENGRKDDPTKSYLNSEAGQKTFKWIQDMNQEGIYKNYGQNWSDTQKAFSSGKLAMYIDTTAVTGIWLDTINDFDFGTARIPSPDKNWVGAKPGGASLWMSNKVSDEKQEAGWKFIKYLVSPKIQAKWSSKTGYLPVTPKSAKMDPLKSIYDKHPQFKQGVKQLEESKDDPATNSSFESHPEEVSNTVVEAWERILKGKDVKTELDNATKEIDKILNE